MTRTIALESLVKTFGAARALDGLTLEVDAGEVHGFLGPNGAGKSTTMRVLLGLLRIDSGKAELLGGDPWTKAAELHRRLAYVPGDVALWPQLSGGEVIDLIGRMRGGLDEARRAELIERFELDPSKKSRTYSKGNRQKVALVAAFASDAELLLLDEPTSGLDPLMEAEFQRCVREVKERGGTVLLSSHILGEVEALCDRVSIIRKGRTVSTGTFDDLRSVGRTTVMAETREPVLGLAQLRSVGSSSWDVTDDDNHRVRFDVDTDDLDSAMQRLTAASIVTLTATPPSLEELFLSHYGDHERDEQDRGEQQSGGGTSGDAADFGAAVDDSDFGAPKPGRQQPGQHDLAQTEALPTEALHAGTLPTTQPITKRRTGRLKLRAGA